MSCSSSRVFHAPGRWIVLAVVCWLGGTGCIRELEPDLSAPTPWEIQAAPSIDDGAGYWPGTQWRTALPAQVQMDSAAMATLSPVLPLIGGGATRFQPIYAGDVGAAVAAALDSAATPSVTEA